MANLRLKKEIIKVVDNQIKANDPPCTKRTYEILQDIGYSKTEAKEKIGAIILEDIYYVLKEGHSFDEAKYEAKLNQLIVDCDQEYNREYDENDEGPWTGIQELIWNGYDAVEQLDYDTMLKNWLPAWEQLKVIVDGAEEKPSILNVDEATDFTYQIYNWLQDMEMELGNAKEYEKRINFCKEVLELFTWDLDSPDNYKAAIGESFHLLGQVEECDAWYESWSGEEPGNPACINSQIWCLLDRNEMDRAKTLIEEYFDGNMECNIQNEILFRRAAALYKTLGDELKASFYENKLSTFQESYQADLMQYGSDDEYPFLNNQPVVKDKKVYPNEPCPCGSGKKYKKCGGRS